MKSIDFYNIYLPFFDNFLGFEINHGYSNKIKSVLMVFTDAYIFAGLLCHFLNTLKLDELYMKSSSGKTHMTDPVIHCIYFVRSWIQLC